MATPQQQDWFAANAPQATAQPQPQAQPQQNSGQDWFAQNGPTQQTQVPQGTGVLSGVGDELSSIWQSLKNTPELFRPPDPGDPNEAAISLSAASRPALAAYRIGKGILAQIHAGSEAVRKAQAQGEGHAGQTLIQLENLPFVGDIAKRAASGDVSGAVSQGATRALSFGAGSGELSEALGVGKAGEAANAALKSGAGAVADATGVSKLANSANRVAAKVSDALQDKLDAAATFKKEATDKGIPVGPLASKNAQAKAVEKALQTSQTQIASAKATRSAELVKAGESIADEISSQAMSPVEASRFTADALDKAKQTASAHYSSALEDISNAGARDVPVNLPNLQPLAKQLVNELELPDNFSGGLKDVQGRDSAINFLKQFADPKGTPAKTGSILGADGKPLVTEAAKPASLTWENARRLKSQLNAWSNSGEITVGKGALQQMTGALDGAMHDALVSAGKPDLAQQFRTASKGYGETMSAFEEGAIGRLAEKNPDAVASALLNKSSTFNVDTLRKTIGAKNMPVVERSLWESVFNKAVDADGNLNGKALRGSFRRLGPDVTQAIWGNRPGMLPKINQFVEDAAKYEDTFKQQAADSAQHIAELGTKANDARMFSNGGKYALGAAAEPLVHFVPGGIALKLAPYAGGVYLGYKLLANPVVLESLSGIMRTGMQSGVSAAKAAAQNQAAIGKIMMVLNSTHASESMRQDQ